VALKRSPTRLVLVQIWRPEARLSVDPAAMVPTLPAEPALVRVTVLPLAVVAVVVVRGRVVVVVLAGVVVRGAEELAAGVVVAGTSVRAGCAALSRFAS
jgi:hypothetical protein